MTGLFAGSSKGQLKIQQMAFVLVAFMILFGLAALFFLSLNSSGLKNDVNQVRHDKAQELVRKLASTPEFSWTVDDCSSCLDLDKVLALKNRSTTYKDFWGPDVKLLQVKEVYPTKKVGVECTAGNYPDCSDITIIKNGAGYSTEEAFVALCRLEGQPIHTRCSLGKIVMGVASA